MSLHELIEKCGYPLVERDVAGIHVALFYDRKEKDNGVYVFYCDDSGDTSFVLNPPKFLAIDAYTHPIVYADGALNGIDNPRRLVPVELVAA